MRTDNGNLKAKLDLRRKFLSEYPPRKVLDCCQGRGYLWSILSREYPLETYTPLDTKSNGARLRIDSARFIASCKTIDYDVIDVDAYGMPWRHWYALLPKIEKPTTVFLTVGMIRMNGIGKIGSRSLNDIGIKFQIPPSIQPKLLPLAIRSALMSAKRYNIIYREAVQAVTHCNAVYIGVRVEKKEIEQ